MSWRIIIFILFIFQVKNCVPDDCDLTQSPAQEGNVGQAATFPWLGVIRVHLHEGTKLRIALTGSILVKATHAIAIADDVAKIPRKIFQYDSKAMFIPNGGQPWLCQLKDYLLHPEYEYATYNTIAIIELEPEEEITIPMLPICWPTYLYNASNQLYVLGYTDEKQLLEKVIHRVQYVDKSLCEEYYNRAGLTDHRYTPTHYQCALAGNNMKDCDWDNGMVLASNSTGTWVLIGFGIRGPGCSAPSRFIEIFQYLPWIDTSTSNLQYPDDSYRKSAFGIGFMQTETKQRMKDIPVHQLFRSNDNPVTINRENGPENEGVAVMYHRLEDMYWKEYNIEQIDKDGIVISKFRNQYEKKKGDCSNRFKRLCYTETAKIHAYPQVKGIASFKLALMDLAVHDYTCVTIRVVSEANSATQLWYDVSMDVDEPLAKFDRTPGFLLKKYPLPSDPSPEKKKTDKYLEPHFVFDNKKLWSGQPNVNLFVQFKFIDEAFLKLQVWGPAATTKSASTLITTTSAISTCTTSTSDNTSDTTESTTIKYFSTFRPINTIKKGNDEGGNIIVKIAKAIWNAITSIFGRTRTDNNPDKLYRRKEDREFSRSKEIPEIARESETVESDESEEARVVEVEPWKQNSSGYVHMDSLCIILAIYIFI